MVNSVFGFGLLKVDETTLGYDKGGVLPFDAGVKVINRWGCLIRLERSEIDGMYIISGGGKTRAVRGHLDLVVIETMRCLVLERRGGNSTNFGFCVLGEIELMVHQFLLMPPMADAEETRIRAGSQGDDLLGQGCIRVQEAVYELIESFCS